MLTNGLKEFEIKTWRLLIFQSGKWREWETKLIVCYDFNSVNQKNELKISKKKVKMLAVVFLEAGILSGSYSSIFFINKLLLLSE